MTLFIWHKVRFHNKVAEEKQEIYSFMVNQLTSRPENNGNFHAFNLTAVMTNDHRPTDLLPPPLMVLKSSENCNRAKGDKYAWNSFHDEIFYVSGFFDRCQNLIFWSVNCEFFTFFILVLLVFQLFV